MFLASPALREQHDVQASTSRIVPWLAAAGAVVTLGVLTAEKGAPTQAEAARKVNLLSPEPSSHRTLKEMNEQPEAIARALKFGECMSYEKVMVSDLDQIQDKVRKITHLTLSAQGTSLNAARYGERLMKQLRTFDSVASIDTDQMKLSDFPCLDVDTTGLIVVSDCNGPVDIPDVVASAMEKGVTVMNVVNTVGSVLAHTNKVGDVGNHSDADNTVNSTKAFTTQVTVLALIALWFKENRDRDRGNGPSSEALELKEALVRLPIAFGMTLTKRDQCRKIAKRLQGKDHCLVLGKGKCIHAVTRAGQYYRISAHPIQHLMQRQTL